MSVACRSNLVCMIASNIIQSEWRGVVGLSSGIPDAYSRCVLEDEGLQSMGRRMDGGGRR